MTFDEWEKLPPDRDVGAASPDELDRMIWDAAIAAERERIGAAIRHRLARLESLIERGKGVWPDRDYVRDATWDGWIATASELRGILRGTGLEDA